MATFKQVEYEVTIQFANGFQVNQQSYIRLISPNYPKNKDGLIMVEDIENGDHYSFPLVNVGMMRVNVYKIHEQEG